MRVASPQAETRLHHRSNDIVNLEHRTQDGVDIIKLPERLMMADAADARATLKEIILNSSVNSIREPSEEKASGEAMDFAVWLQ